MNSEGFINLQHQVERHEAEFNALTERIAKLEADLEVILRFTDVVQQVRLEVGIAEAPKSEWSGAQPVDPALLEKYEAFLNRHGSIGGVTR